MEGNGTCTAKLNYQGSAFQSTDCFTANVRIVDVLFNDSRQHLDANVVSNCTSVSQNAQKLGSIARTDTFNQSLDVLVQV